ncbi:MAG: hypothetical protein WAW41_04700 [Methylobacter sp.]
MTDEELNIMQHIRKAAGVGCKPMLYDMPDVVKRLKNGNDRYEKIRRLTPLQFSSLYQRNLEFGIPFDELVDEL